MQSVIKSSTKTTVIVCLSIDFCATVNKKYRKIKNGTVQNAAETFKCNSKYVRIWNGLSTYIEFSFAFACNCGTMKPHFFFTFIEQHLNIWLHFY